MSSTIRRVPSIRTLHDQRDLLAVNELFGRVWGLTPPKTPIDAGVLRALAFSQNYVAGAFVDDELVGGSVAFWGRDSRGWILHSHVTAVDPQARGVGIGSALKTHQRAWSLQRGVDRISWTFDPLIRRNAYFNLVRLGAVATEYHEVFYGEMSDLINAGDFSDRCVAIWDVAPAPGGTRSAVLDSEDARKHVILEPASTAVDAEPIVRSDRIVVGVALRAFVPSDVELMRRSDPQLAQRWRLALRATLGVAMHRGFVAAEMTRDGWYTLREPAAEVTPVRS